MLMLTGGFPCQFGFVKSLKLKFQMYVLEFYRSDSFLLGGFKLKCFQQVTGCVENFNPPGSNFVGLNNF